MARRMWIVSAAAWVLLLAQSAVARPHPRPDTIRLKVSVFNDAQVPQYVLQAAVTRAQAVFERAGVSLTWLDCGTPGNWHTELGCLDVAFPSHLSVRLVKGKQTGSDDIFGQSFLNEHDEGNYANVYVTPLSSAKARELLPEGDLLGCIVVHELGHLLLGRNSHSNEGLMRAKWEVWDLREAARGNLLFTKAETERMRVRYFSAVARADGASSRLNASGK